MATAQHQSTRLSNLQIELLKLYPYNVSEAELSDIRRLLADYFARRADEEMTQLWNDKGWDAQTLEVWKNEHLRSHTS